MKKYILSGLILLSTSFVIAQQNDNSKFKSKLKERMEKILLKDNLNWSSKLLLNSLSQNYDLSKLQPLKKNNSTRSELQPLSVIYKSKELICCDDYVQGDFKIEIQHSLNLDKKFYIKQKLNGNTWENIWQYTDSYNSENLKVSHEIENWISNRWIKESRRLYEYDGNKNRIGEYFQTQINKNYITVERTRNEFNSSGEITYSLKEKGDTTNIGSSNEVKNWKPVNDISREYGGNGKLVKLTTTTWEEYGLTTKSEYIYNPDELIESITIYFYSITTSAIQQLYTYYPDGKLETMLTRELHKSEWINYDFVNLIYDSRGNEIMFLIQEWNDGDWVNEHRYKSEYNEKDEITKEVQEYWIEGNWGAKSRELYSYNSYGKMIE